MELGPLLVETSPFMLDSALLIARVFIGLCFVMHGLGKLGLVGEGDMAGFVGWLTSMGIPFPGVQARIAMLSEITGGLLLTFGLLTRPACLLLIGTMLVAWRLGHRGAGYMITNDPPGAEYVINLAAVCLVFLLTGPGAFSLDAALF